MSKNFIHVNQSGIQLNYLFKSLNEQGHSESRIQMKSTHVVQTIKLSQGETPVDNIKHPDKHYESPFRGNKSSSYETEMAQRQHESTCRAIKINMHRISSRIKHLVKRTCVVLFKRDNFHSRSPRTSIKFIQR